MKKIMVVFLSIMMIVSLAAASFADGAALSCSATNDQLNRGDMVTVAVSLSGAPDVKSMQLTFDIPTDVFTVDGGWSISGTIADFNKSKNLAVIAFESPTNINGSIFTLDLTVKDDAAYEDFDVAITPTVKVSSEAGETEVPCAGTSVTLTVIDPSCRHNNKTSVAAKDSTCIDQGWDAYAVCGSCGQLFSADGKEISEIHYRAINPDNHTGNTEIRNQKDATCTENGNSGDTYCKDCGALISAGSKIKALGHDFGEWITTVAPTETTEGEQTRTCSRNWQHVETRTVPKADHVHDLNHIAANKATCDQPGNKEYWVCSTCNRHFSDAQGSNEINANDVIIAPADHQWGEWVVTREAKAGEKGEETRTCIYDSNHKETREIPSLPETENTDAQTEEPSTVALELPEITVPENEIIENPDTPTEEPSTVALEVPEITVPENEIIENPDTQTKEPSTVAPELPEITVPENEIIENPDTQTEEPSTVALEVPEITVPENVIIENPETANDENTAIWLPVVIIALLGAAAVAIIVIRIKKMTAPEIL
ncbi:MAG: hypothetical protein IJK34_00530 [Clostridia bacterium]|nr:hypothetical protein [Clostridia bacterium]